MITLAVLGLLLLPLLLIFVHKNRRLRAAARAYEGPWRPPSRWTPILRWKGYLRGWNCHKRDPKWYVRFRPNPGFQVGKYHWCRLHKERGY